MLGKYRDDVLEEMSRDEFVEWNALIELEHEEESRARSLAKLKAMKHGAKHR